MIRHSEILLWSHATMASSSSRRAIRRAMRHKPYMFHLCCTERTVAGCNPLKNKEACCSHLQHETTGVSVLKNPLRP